MVGQISHSGIANGWAVPVIKSSKKFMKLHRYSYGRFIKRIYAEEVELTADQRKYNESKF
jgi:hypothetical protein